MAEIELREAQQADVDLLFGWLNTASSLAGKLKTFEPVSYRTHSNWFAVRLSDPDTRIWIASSNNIPVGQVRVQRNDNEELIVDIYIAESERGNGYGKKLLIQLGALCDSIWKNLPLIAEIRHGNRSSISVFRSANYRPVEELADYVKMRWFG
jgi:RimJ/RimL family protein N-acetyltransferase